MKLYLLKFYKQQKGYSFETLAKLSGVPQSTIQKIFCGVTKNPRASTVNALEKVLLPKAELDAQQSGAQHPGGYAAGSAACEPGMLKDPSPAYNAGTSAQAKRRFTLDDYYGLGEDVRVELIDGVFYDMTAPLTRHQLVAGEIYRQIKNQIMEKKGGCMVFVAPTDVQLDMDEYTMLQPDIFIVCDRSKIVRRCVYGAPDFVAEVLSPSTRRRDLVIKLHKYMAAGVREYWIIDPEKQKVAVYDFTAQDLPIAVHGFDETIGLLIYDGNISVDFSIIRDDIAQWGEEDR